MPSNHLIFCHPHLFLPKPFPTSISFPMRRLFASGGPSLELKLQQQFSNEYSGLISFRINWFDRAVQGTLKNLFQYHNSKISIFWLLVFFMVQLSQSYTTAGKTIAFTIRIFVIKVMSLLFNMLSRLVITFLPRSKRLLISWLQSPSAVILEPKEIKSVTASTFPPYICHEVMGPDTMILVL